MMFNTSVDKKSTKPKANAARVFGLSNSVSPVNSVMICTVTVVTGSKGLNVSDAMMPAAMTTIMVSPMARLAASRTPLMMPGNAEGRRTLVIVSPLVAPRA